MDWAGQAVVECIMAIAFGLFIGWVIVTGIKVSRSNEERKEKRRKERTAEKDNSRAIKQIYEEGMEKLRKQQFLDQLYETSKSKPGSSEQKTSGGGIDEYHK